MLFNSIIFAVFMAIVFIIYWSVPNKYRWVVLLAASIYFYLGYGIKYFLLLGMMILFSYMSMWLISQNNSLFIRKFLLVVTILAIVVFLGYFKYYSFAIENLNKILDIFTEQLNPTTKLIAIPVGISFYSFKILSYVVDVYKGSRMEKSLGKYALYVMFFPEISSGPIDRGKDLFPQFSQACVFNYKKVSYGLKLIAWGLFKKIVIADTLSYGVDLVYISYESYKGSVLFIISIFYTIQIYCDFSGYSDMAVGVAKMLGIEVVRNFKTPYFSASVKEFWRRWHISLSSWLRDYIYIPLGGGVKKEQPDIMLILW